jgi:hypothetical protein
MTSSGTNPPRADSAPLASAIEWPATMKVAPEAAMKGAVDLCSTVLQSLPAVLLGIASGPIGMRIGVKSCSGWRWALQNCDRCCSSCHPNERVGLVDHG